MHKDAITSHFVTFLLGLVVGMALMVINPARAQVQELPKEKGFPLGKTITESRGTPFCSSEEDAKKLVILHASEGEEKAADFFWGPESLCWQARMSFDITYTRLVHSVTLKDGTKLNIYAGNVPNVGEIFVITDWNHQKSEV